MHSLMVPIHWFSSAITSKGVSQGVYENPETGEVFVKKAVLIRDSISGNYWSILTDTGEPLVVGDRPKQAVVSVSKSWLTAHKKGFYKVSLPKTL